MGQSDILELLNEEKKLFPDKWFTIVEIKKMLKEKGKPNGSNTHQNVLKPACFGFIKMRGIGIWQHHKEYQGV